MVDGWLLKVFDSLDHHTSMMAMYIIIMIPFALFHQPIGKLHGNTRVIQWFHDPCGFRAICGEL